MDVLSRQFKGAAALVACNDRSSPLHLGPMAYRRATDTLTSVRGEFV